MPSVYSVSNSSPLDSSTVMTPSLPTFSITSAMRLPISGSAAEIAATWAISSLPFTGVACSWSFCDEGVGRQVDALLEQHGVGAGGDVAHPLVHDGLGQNDGGRRAVTGDVVGLGGRFLEQLRAHVGEVIVELDLLGDGDAVVGDGRRAPFLVEGDVAALGTERGLDRVGEGVDALFQGLTSLGVELENLGHE